MKNTLIIISVFIVLFTGCTKELDEINSNPTTHSPSLTQKSYMPEAADLYNLNNPFDSYGANLRILYEDLEIVLSDSNLTQAQLEVGIANILMARSSINYPSVDTTTYSVLEAAIFSDYVQDITINNLVNNSLQVETEIANSTTLNIKQKNRLFSLVSQFKFNFLYMAELCQSDAKAAGWDDCMRRELGDIFNDNNPVDDIGFIVGVPGSFLWVAGYCAYESLS